MRTGRSERIFRFFYACQFSKALLRASLFAPMAFVSAFLVGEALCSRAG
jgi:hypothetical protein